MVVSADASERALMAASTPACVLFLAVACVRLFAAPVEAGYVTSSALLSRPPSQRRSSQLYMQLKTCGLAAGAVGERAYGIN